VRGRWKERSESVARGERIYSRKIKPLLRDALGWVIVVRVTQKPGDATHIIQTANIQSFTAVGIIGGDGTVHEVLQGLLNRPDWNECVRTPLIPIPVGSGNALAKSIGDITPFCPHSRLV